MATQTWVFTAFREVAQKALMRKIAWAKESKSPEEDNHRAEYYRRRREGEKRSRGSQTEKTVAEALRAGEAAPPQFAGGRAGRVKSDLSFLSNPVQRGTIKGFNTECVSKPRVWVEFSRSNF
jgi:hypothetical protein